MVVIIKSLSSFLERLLMFRKKEFISLKAVLLSTIIREKTQSLE
ncbi:hypothetical protein A0G_0279 [Streptococcus iniae 9117]|nr:hypothetical protein A0G_0279 [Streptococcus iniae 9117]